MEILGKFENIFDIRWIFEKIERNLRKIRNLKENLGKFVKIKGKFCENWIGNFRVKTEENRWKLCENLGNSK